ncbi:MAG: MaoC protein dehydratase [Marmoricola sp.]|nr:MaoC protein dehydratase [Marmoricola sp.]
MTRAPVPVTVGARPEPRTVGPVTITDVVRFAGASGDFNPLHHDPDRARAAGFGAPIAMGQYTAGLLAAWLTDWCGVQHLRRYEVRFTAPLHLGDTVTLSGEVTTVDGGLARLVVRATGSEGDLLTGSAEVVVG